MKLTVIIPLMVFFTSTHQTTSPDQCVCELNNSEKLFPQDKLSTVEDGVSQCNSKINPQKTVELESLLLGLDRRLPQLEDEVSILEKEDDGDLFGVLSLYVIENEMVEIKQLMDRLKRTMTGDQHLTDEATQQLLNMGEEMKELVKFDTMQVVKKQEANQRLRRDLDQCRNGHPPPTRNPLPPHGSCPYGELLNITKPRVFTAGEYAGSYKYGSWGRDPKPEAGKENWYWRVMSTVSNVFSHYVRQYSSLSSLIIGVSVPGNVVIHPSNPTTNTIQGPNAVMYGGSLYYNCYNQAQVCRFHLADKTVTNLQLPSGTRFNSKSNFCRLDECYPYTDLDLATDESGVWVIYSTTQDLGNLVLSKVEEGQTPTLGRTWRSSIYKNAVTNTFMACGVLYATRFLNKDVEEIFYSLDTATGKERFDLGIHMTKMSPNIQALNYSPVDQMLHAYSDANMVSYKVVFQLENYTDS